MSIINMAYGGGSKIEIPLSPISNLAATSGDETATLTWTDPDDVVYQGVTIAAWDSTKIVRKTGSAPTTSSDGTLVTTETTKNQYSSTGYIDSGLANGTTYYYGAFAVADNGTEVISNTPDVTPAGYVPTSNTLFYYPLTSNANDYSGRGRDATAVGTTFSSSGADISSGGYISFPKNKFPTFFYTISMWVQISGYNCRLFSDWGGGNNNIMYIQAGDSSLQMYTGAGGNSGSSRNTNQMATNTRYNIVVTRTGDRGRTWTLYNNGVQKASNSGLWTYGGQGSEFGIGNIAGGTVSFKYKDVIIEDGGWSSQQVVDYFNLSKGKFGY